jgi:cation diffusion facilitator CzcD-associated flavoprotein CzcO
MRAIIIGAGIGGLAAALTLRRADIEVQAGHVAYRGLVPAERLVHLGMEVSAYSWWGPQHHFVHYFVGTGARYVNW